MRLLNTTTLNFEWFTDNDIPKYFILSHRWQGEETTLQGFNARGNFKEEEWTQGTKKVVQFIEYARKRHSKYVWIDTVCIDKTSSTELQEAINSMYKWYEQSVACIVYLDDVNMRSEDYHVDIAVNRALKQRVVRSEWFTRGWTLQELLAPQQLAFVDQNWSVIGSRDDLINPIVSLTTVDRSCFGNRQAIRRQPVAKRMSWLSSRRTSRTEDLAYCMLGIFGINMTMLYGEGDKAFLRLQREIIQEIEDDSIFVWALDPLRHGINNPLHSTILAPHPSCFSICGKPQIKTDISYHREPYRVTTRGLEIEHYDKRKNQFKDKLMIVLNCKMDDRRVYIPISRFEHYESGSNVWTRHRCTEVVTSDLFRKNDHKSPNLLSAWEIYRKEASKASLPQRLTIQETNYGTTNNFVSRPVQAQALGARMDYENELIKFKVYIP